MIGSVWAIAESALPDAQARYAAMLQAMVAGGVVEDGRKLGLAVQNVSGTAVIPVVGPMLRRVGMWESLFGFIGHEQVGAALASANSDEQVQRIVLAMDTPGGDVSGVEELAQAVATSAKPVHVQVQGMLASAGYYVAARASSITAGPGDLVGSIGTRMVVWDTSEMFASAGIKVHAIDTGEYKSAGEPGLPVTDEQLAEFQRITDFYMDQFVASIVSGRKLDKASVLEAADGRLFTPKQAKGMGLIDSVGTMADTMGALRSRRSVATARRQMALAERRVAMPMRNTIT